MFVFLQAQVLFAASRMVDSRITDGSSRGVPTADRSAFAGSLTDESSSSLFGDEGALPATRVLLGPISERGAIASERSRSLKHLVDGDVVIRRRGVVAIDSGIGERHVGADEFDHPAAEGHSRSACCSGFAEE